MNLDLFKVRNDLKMAEITNTKEPANGVHGGLGTGWISIDENQPKPRQRVHIVCENPKYGGGVIQYQTMAEYIPYMTVKEEDYMSEDFAGDGDYNEEEDEFYTPEGFYEWQSEPDIHWKISAKVTHWMPLIALPPLATNML